jgi:hypothetical protein
MVKGDIMEDNVVKMITTAMKESAILMNTAMMRSNVLSNRYYEGKINAYMNILQVANISVSCEFSFEQHGVGFDIIENVIVDGKCIYGREMK